MRALPLLLLVCAALCSGCAAVETAPLINAPDDSSVLHIEPRGIVGELCPPALAAKAYC
nr:hypothetical protein [uncultured Noviherbaspirillum sp.]